MLASTWPFLTAKRLPALGAAQACDSPFPASRARYHHGLSRRFWDSARLTASTPRAAMAIVIDPSLS
jgi:hypothetical protein